MGELREIVTVEQMSRLCMALAVILPLLGVVAGALSGARAGSMARGALNGLAAGLLGPLIWLMWHIFNALTDRNGLDTVQNVFVNLAVFVGVGLAIGLAIGRAMRSRLEASPEDAAANEQNLMQSKEAN